MDLKECFEKGFIKKTKVNQSLIKSLVEMANIKEIAVKSANIDEVNISAYVSLAYDSLREILDSLCISKGYKVLLHLCTGELLKSIIEDFDFNQFDRLRYIRNGINYYGEKVDFEQGKEIIKKIFLMKKKILENYLK